jgi:hypothetical protein
MAALSTAVLALSTVAAGPASALTVTNRTMPSLATSIDCLTKSLCVSVGDTPQGIGAVVAIKHGVPGKLQKVKGTDNGILSVSCAGGKGCVAIAPTPTGKLMFINIGKTGKVTSKKEVKVTILDSFDRISCATIHSCELAGVRIVNAVLNHVAVAHWNGKKLSDLRAIKVANASDVTAAGLSCRNSYCVAVGQMDLRSGASPFGAYLLPIKRGKPGKLVRTKASTSLQAVACVTASLCYADGDHAEPAGVVLTFAHNKITKTATVAASLDGIACAGHSCTAVGSQLPTDSETSRSAFVGDLVPVSSGTPAMPYVDLASGGYGSVARVGRFFEAVGSTAKSEHATYGESEVTSN